MCTLIICFVSAGILHSTLNYSRLGTSQITEFVRWRSCPPRTKIQEFVFCLLWKLCRETRCINLQSNSVTGFNYKPSPAIFFPPQWISSASVTPDEELRKSCWHFDRCTTSFFCGTVRVQIPGGDVALPLEYKTNPHMPAWQITYRYLCDLHQCGTSNRSCGGGGSGHV